MTISASRRTDIPVVYFALFWQRLKAGYVYVVNPFNRNQVKRIFLRAFFVEYIVLWTV
ncbi:DUF1848 family protein [uncultured Anaerovibrio sp.]|uniref:DUF1848 family protein n=1 Tax=uncultured Anaerovibrio sp. TaxID=361586 RepID=UPI0034176B32